MKNLTVKKICEITDGICQLFPEGEISSVVIDSRTVIADSMFVAFKGEKTDGHDYIANAAAAGAKCILCEHSVDVDIPQIVVKSSLTAVQKLAEYYRTLFDIPFVGITGSVGKTTAKEMIASVLSQKWNVLKTEKNLNNELGVPLTIFRLNDQYQAAVIEMGISDFGEMTVLSKMVKPDIAVFTLIGDAHLEFLHNRAGVLKAKSEITSFMPSSGVVICNKDDPYLANAVFGKQTLYYGIDNVADIQAVNLNESKISSVDCDLNFQNQRISVSIPSFGHHMIYAALMGCSVGVCLGLDSKQIKNGIEQFRNVGSRGRVIDCGKFTIIDDCYNSNPSSAEASIKSLKNFSGRHICILGDMLELGDESASLHYKIGLIAKNEGVHVIACGPYSKFISEAVGNNTPWFENVEELVDKLPELISDGDVVLVKASHGMNFAKVTDALIQLKI